MASVFNLVSSLSSFFKSSQESLRTKVTKYAKDLNNTKLKSEIDTEIRRLKEEIPRFVEDSTNKILENYRTLGDCKNLKFHLRNLYRVLLQLNSCEVIVAKWLYEEPKNVYSTFIPIMLNQILQVFESTTSEQCQKDQYIEMIKKTAQYVEDVRALNYYYHELKLGGDCQITNRKLVLADDMIEKNQRQLSSEEIQDIENKFSERGMYGKLIKHLEKEYEELDLAEFLKNLDQELTQDDFKEGGNLYLFMESFPKFPSDLSSFVKIVNMKRNQKSQQQPSLTSLVGEIKDTSELAGSVYKIKEKDKSQKLWRILGWISCLLFSVLLFMTVYFRNDQTMSIAFGIACLVFLCLVIVAVYKSRKINLMFALFLSCVVISPIAYYMNAD